MQRLKRFSGFVMLLIIVSALIVQLSENVQARTEQFFSPHAVWADEWLFLPLQVRRISGGQVGDTPVVTLTATQQAPAPTGTATQAAFTATATRTAQPSVTSQPSSSPTPAAPTATLVPPTATLMQPTVTPVTPQPTHTPFTTPIVSGFIIDHTNFDQAPLIPDVYIQAAASLSSLFRHASVGLNVSQGLDCLQNNIDPRPNYCDRGLAPEEIYIDPRYDRTNFVFEFHDTPPGQNPPWWDKTTMFLDRVNNPQAGEDYDVVAYKLGYVDGVPGINVDELFFNNNPNDSFPSIEDLEALQNDHPEKVVVLWTMGLARSVGTYESQSFNQQTRAYAQQNGWALMDIAAISSHRPDGSPCTTNGYEAMCAEYTDEVEGGHLNARGRARMAQAFWVMTAYLAGWQAP